MNQDLNTTGHNPDDISVNGNTVYYWELRAPRYDILSKAPHQEHARGNYENRSLTNEFYTHAPLNLLLPRLFVTDGTIPALIMATESFKIDLIDHTNKLLLEANPEINKRYDGLRLASRSMSAFGVGSEAKIRYVSLNGSVGPTISAEICHLGKDKDWEVLYSDSYEIDVTTGKMTYKQTAVHQRLGESYALMEPPEVRDATRDIHTDIATRTSNLLN